MFVSNRANVYVQSFAAFIPRIYLSLSLWTVSKVSYSKKGTEFEELDLFPSSGGGIGRGTYSVASDR